MTMLRWPKETDPSKEVAPKTPDERNAPAVGVDCTSKAWRSDKTRYATCGPYQATVVLKLDPAALKKAPGKGWLLVSLGSAGELRLRADGRLYAQRMAERRNARHRPHAVSGRRIVSRDLVKPLHITLTWTGAYCTASIDAERWLSFPCRGTRALGDVTVGPLPGRLLAVTVAAR